MDNTILKCDFVFVVACVVAENVLPCIWYVQTDAEWVLSSCGFVLKN